MEEEPTTLAEWQDRIAQGLQGPPELEAILERATHLRNETSRELRKRLLPYFVHHAQMFDALKVLVTILEWAINATPTGMMRNARCDLNIRIRALIAEIDGK